MAKLKRTIKALSLGKISEGSIGFITTEKDDVSTSGGPRWFNVLGEPDILEELVKNVVAKGNTIEYEYNNGVVGNLKLLEKAKEKESGKFDDMTNFEDLLADAHEKFKNTGFNIKTEMISMDYEKKRALFSACVSIETWVKNSDNMLERSVQLFTAHGDAEGIGSDMIKPHFIRMAETRAIARALRWATNNAKVAEEETSGGKEVPKKK